MSGKCCKSDCDCHRKVEQDCRMMTLMILKCEALRRKLIPQILIRLQAKELCVVDMAMVCPSDCELQKCYCLDDAPVLVVLVEGPFAVPVLQQVVGNEREPGTFRGDFGNCGDLVYVSCSIEDADRDIQKWSCFFNVFELCSHGHKGHRGCGCSKKRFC